MKKLFGMLSIFAALTITSCESNEDTCKTCNATAVTTMDGEEIQSMEIDATSYCGDELEAIELNPSQTVTMNQGGMEVVMTTNFDCK